MNSMVRRSEEHTSELQSRQYLVCRLLLEKKKKSADDCPPALAITDEAEITLLRIELAVEVRRRGQDPTRQTLVTDFYLSFFFNDTATTEIYTLSLHDALPICLGDPRRLREHAAAPRLPGLARGDRSEEHTSELQSRQYLVCRLLLEKKKK